MSVTHNILNNKRKKERSGIMQDVLNQVANNGLAIVLSVYLVVNQNTKLNKLLEQLTMSIETMSSTLHELKTEIQLLKSQNVD